MSRMLCDCCNRPLKACICRFITSIDNEVHVVVLQHPKEVEHSKGTISLLTQSLASCQVIVGEDFTDNVELMKVMDKFEPILLYPSKQAIILSNTLQNDLTVKTNKTDTKPICLVVLDGTWKKTYKMFMLSTNLHQLTQVTLPEHLANSGQYHIRKVAKHNALSSLEASCYALALLEGVNDALNSQPGNTGKYQIMFDKFSQFNEFQLSFRPEQRSLEET